MVGLIHDGLACDDAIAILVKLVSGHGLRFAKPARCSQLKGTFLSGPDIVFYMLALGHAPCDAIHIGLANPPCLSRAVLGLGQRQGVSIGESRLRAGPPPLEALPYRASLDRSPNPIRRNYARFLVTRPTLQSPRGSQPP
jgi:hypothetical protein